MAAAFHCWIHTLWIPYGAQTISEGGGFTSFDAMMWLPSGAGGLGPVTVQALYYPTWRPRRRR